MRSFVQFIIEGLSDFSPTELGLINRIVYIPDKKPYGFWMDRHGNYIPVFERMGHDKVAMEILDKAGEDYEEEGYDTLLRAGWVRVVTFGNTYLYYETYPGVFLNNIQKQNLQFMNDYYDLGGIKEG